MPGEEDAAVLMSHLPPSGWSDVVRIADLDARVALVDARFDTLDHRFEAIDHRFEAMDQRFDTIGHRFEVAEARFEARLAEQGNRTVGRLAAVGGLLLIVDQLLSRV